MIGFPCPKCGKPESSFDGEHYCGKCEEEFQKEQNNWQAEALRQARENYASGKSHFNPDDPNQ